MPKLILPYTAEFHQQIVDLACAGRALAQLSRGFGLTAQVIANSIDLNGRYRGKPVSGKVSPIISRREDLVRLHSRRLLSQAEQVRHSGKLKETISSSINALKSTGLSMPQPVPPCKRGLPQWLTPHQCNHQLESQAITCLWDRFKSTLNKGNL